MIRPRITGTGSAVPEKVLTNFDLEKMVDTTDEWIVTRTGIRERRIASEGEYTSTFAIAAAERAMAAAGVKAEEIDMIVVGTLTPDFPFPATACIVQQAIKATNAFCFDLSAACSGFIYALATAQKFMVSGQVKKALVIGAEVLSRIVDWNDRNTCLLFGDGAGAVVLEAQEGENGILSTHMHSDGNYWEILYQKGAGSRNPATHQNVDDGLVFLTMQGNEVFKLAVRSMGEVAMEALEANGLTPADVNLFIPHQANQRIVDSVGKRLGITGDRVFVNLDRYGNTSAASIPIALDEAVRAGRLKEGDLLLLDAFGGGLTWGSALVRW
ncbi:ketoacyl-ACP synthase III [Geomonas sp. Red69]|uniref:Beta-ketoacyl-[acyl-carrier-protein] synthase III n=1 Tax=Geomonas diazotrophica TaxID=2843197 RepID=A0ABX8JN80_9BACT|nr:MULTISPECIES: beta-ketoacyl-ACP synthase III [Geomonas]MBU5636634.1 ketoacyl-ACP synthase III [Geomonas diazotrophica]QWV98546.1 ketoacyl-ACP synthase III [Geomonas nitrogeniifigens]QXE87729.1 ketoacyl-ACP synthase III [Geomonas nitrogeniifigens]